MARVRSSKNPTFGDTFDFSKLKADLARKLAEAAETIRQSEKGELVMPEDLFAGVKKQAAAAEAARAKWEAKLAEIGLSAAEAGLAEANRRATEAWWEDDLSEADRRAVEAAWEADCAEADRRAVEAAWEADHEAAYRSYVSGHVVTEKDGELAQTPIKLCLFDLDDTLLRTNDLDPFRGAGNVGNASRSYTDNLLAAFADRTDRLLYSMEHHHELRRTFPDMKWGVFTQALRNNPAWGGVSRIAMGRDRGL